MKYVCITIYNCLSWGIFSSNNYFLPHYYIQLYDQRGIFLGMFLVFLELGEC